MTRRERIEKEIADFQKKNGNRWPLFFNNFTGRLPFGFYRSLDAETLNAKHPAPKASKKYRNMTLAEFHQEIDLTIRELGLDPNTMRSLKESRDLDRLHQYILPLYIRMREKGYKHYPDLTA